MLLLTAACSTRPTDVPTAADTLIVPDVQGYTAAEQKQAYDERQQYCKFTPMMCRMINDFGRMRDQARLALGLEVDVNR